MGTKMQNHRVLTVLVFMAGVYISPGKLFAQSIEKSNLTLTPQSIEERMAANLQPTRAENNLTLPYFESGKESVAPASAVLLATTTDVSVVDPTIDQWAFRRSLPLTLEPYSQSFSRVPFWLSEAIKPEKKQGIQWKDTFLQSL